ncbi:MAG TPA: polysaccharide deacetylase family protein [Thermoleophilaceae bacterium]|nr:polysaccharide deacetylase family protein [Thermoleophilaceae bacterium]
MPQSATVDAPARAGRVALTFDDGPDREWTPRVLNVLAVRGASATFFVMGPRASAHPGLIRRMVADGHEVALHAERHVRHSELDRDEIAQDASAALARLADIGVKPARWRTPWGVQTPDTEEVASELGLELCGWTADSRDWTGDPAAQMLRRCAPDVVDGCVVLMHDGLRPGATRRDCAETVELTRRLIGLAADRGLRARSLEAR